MIGAKLIVFLKPCLVITQFVIRGMFQPLWYNVTENLTEN